MRDILFRGKRFDNGEWVEGYYCPTPFSRFPCKPAIYPADIINSNWQGIEVIPETIGQYTDLNDKKGQKIFKGDIVRSGVYTGVVRFGEYGYNGERHLGFYIDWSKVSNPYNILRQDLMFWVNDDLEVIGVTGFEPATSASRTLRATNLRYTPICLL